MKYKIRQSAPELVRSPLAMAEWIEISLASSAAWLLLSPLAMAEWIEIFGVLLTWTAVAVSASDGGVD